MYISIYFWAFSSSWKEEKKILLNKCSRNGWATAQLSCEKKIVLQERGLKKKIVLQYNYCIAGWEAWLDCIAAWGKILLQGVALYCNIGSAVARIVLQHNQVYCKRVQWLELYCNTTDCIAMGVQWLELYCNTTNCIAT